MPMVRLHVATSGGTSFDRDFDEDSLVIGRSNDADLVLADRFLSRKHARLYRDGDRLMLEDLGSQNGTRVNGSRIQAPTEVRVGDRIELSSSRIELMEGAGGGDGEPALNATVMRPAAELLGQHDRERVEEAPAEELSHLTDRLQLLNEMYRAVSRPLELDSLFDLTLSQLFDHLQPEEATIFLQTREGEFEPIASRRASTVSEGSFYSRALVREVAEKGMAVLVLDARTDERFAAAESIMSAGVRSLIAAPLLTPDGSLGMIVLSSRLAVKQFSEGDMDLLNSLAAIVATKVRQLRLAEDAVERARMAEDLKVARRIQVALLPEELPQLEGYELYATNSASRGVSGDFYQVVVRPESNACVLLLADVSGKGMAASLLAAILEAASANPIARGRPLEELTTWLNGYLEQRTPPERFATAFLAELAVDSGRVRYANAGHNPALLLRADGEVETLVRTGIPLGLMRDSTYTASEVDLQAGDRLVLYTDGITEAMNPDDEEYGMKRLIDVCIRASDQAVDALATTIDEDLRAFAAGETFADDRTLVLLRRLPD
jgi:sigma-B regulation protein RsbU (phosphoserine phosphatase)